MKTREYFENKTKEIKIELKEEIKNLFFSKLQKGQCYVNQDDANQINFENHITVTEDSGEISYIDVDDNIVIFPVGNYLDPVDLDNIEDIHSLMMLHYIGLNELVK
jgi:hypothetical protein